MTYAPPRRDFIGKPAPPGYVAGVGRGASGFTTRSDIGPAREMASTSTDRQNKRMKTNDDEDRDDDYLNESNYDEFAGYGGALFNKDPYEEDDEEADKVYESVDKHLDERGKAHRESKRRQAVELYRQERPKIQQEFSDLKPSLKLISEEEWMNLPDVGDARNRKKRAPRQEKFTPLPDSLIAHQAEMANGGDKVVYIDPKTIDGEPDDDDDNQLAGSEQPSGSGQLSLSNRRLNEERSINIGEMNECRSSYMRIKLTSITDPPIDKQTTDPKKFLTNLDSLALTKIPESVIQEKRKLYASLRAANRKSADSWIMSAQLEERAGKLKKARKLIKEGCEVCPDSETVWCEAARLCPDEAKALLAKGVRENPRCVNLYIKAADLEASVELKRKIYANARMMVPKSVELWMRSADLESPDDGREILRNAVDCCPEAVELWLALARLERDPQRARRVLAEARTRHPSERSIWIMGAKMEEAADEHSGAKIDIEGVKFEPADKQLRVRLIIESAVEQLARRGVEIKRDEWLKESVEAEKEGFVLTCREIIRRLVGYNIGNQDDHEARLKIWMADVESFVANKSLECARSVFECIVGDPVFCRRESVWLAYGQFEKRHGAGESLELVLRRSVDRANCPGSETLWLMLVDAIKSQPDEHQEQKEDVKPFRRLDESREILCKALKTNADSERIVLAAVELECEHRNYDEARRILADASSSASTPRLIMRAAKLEWSLDNPDAAVEMLRAGAKQHKSCDEFYLMLGQIEEQRGKLDLAKGHYSEGLRFAPTSIELWISMAKLEERQGLMAKARARLEMARVRNPKVPLLWLEAAKLETRIQAAKRGNLSLVSTILAKGIKECKDKPGVELLFAEQADPKLARQNR